MPLETFPWIAEEHFPDEDSQFDLLHDAVESGDMRYLTHAIGIVARARGIDEIAAKAGIDRKKLVVALQTESGPSLDLAAKVLTAFGLSLDIKRAA